jgi:photosystem II stability/assembly factor-like uncharacterized protein
MLIRGLTVAAFLLGSVPSFAGRNAWSAARETSGIPISTLAVAPSDPSRFYAATANGGMLRSDDGGHRWFQLNFSSDVTLGPISIAVDPGNPDVAYAITLSPVVFSHDYATRLWKTRDGGESWGYQLFPYSAFQEIVVDFANPATIYTTSLGGSLNGVFKSDDGGNHWRRVETAGPWPEDGFGAIAIDPRDPHRLYSEGGGVFRSEDAGESWAPAGLEDPNVSQVLIPGDEARTVLAATPVALWRTTDEEGSWSIVFGLPAEPIQLAVDAVDPNVVYAETWHREVFISEDAGATWSPLSYPGLSPGGLVSFGSFTLRGQIVSTREGLVTGTDSGIFAFDYVRVRSVSSGSSAIVRR